MVKNRHLKRLIEDAIERCSGVKLRSAKSHLLRALKEVSEAEKREEKRKSQTPEQRWKFDASAGRLKNMTAEQLNNALGKIEKMIEDEAGKTDKTDEEGQFFIG